MSIPGELGATRDAARQQRAERADEPESRAAVQDAAPKKKGKDSGGQEGCDAVGVAADSGAPTIVVINAGQEKEGEREGGLDTAQVRPAIPESAERPGAGAEDAEDDSAGHMDGEEDAQGDSAVLEDLGQRVLDECGTIGSAETSPEGLAEFVASLASGGAEGAVKVLENFGPVGPLFKCLGMFMHFVGQVKAARGEGARLKIWAQTLIPIIRQSVPSPFPADMEKSKQEELTQCTQQAVEAIESLQDAIGEVAKSKESWSRFFTAGKYMERMTEAKKQVETAVDLIQKHLILDTKSEVLKLTAVLKGVWGSLTDLQQGVADLRPKLEAGLAEMRAEFKNVNDKLDKQDEKLQQILDLVAQSDLQDTTPDTPLTHATIPPEVPELPAVLQTRQTLLEEMKLRVLSESQASCTTSLVGVSRGAANASKSLTAHGMGGVGKTTAAVQNTSHSEALSWPGHAVTGAARAVSFRKHGARRSENTVERETPWPLLAEDGASLRRTARLYNDLRSNSPRPTGHATSTCSHLPDFQSRKASHTRVSSWAKTGASKMSTARRRPKGLRFTSSYDPCS